MLGNKKKQEKKRKNKKKQEKKRKNKKKQEKKRKNKSECSFFLKLKKLILYYK